MNDLSPPSTPADFESADANGKPSISRPAPARDEPTARSPFAGCAILIVAMLVMVFLLWFSVRSLFKQYAEIEKFTSDKPAAVELVQLDDRESELNSLAERIESFRQALADFRGDDAEQAKLQAEGKSSADSGAVPAPVREPAELRLDADDLNLAIAAYPAFEDLRGTFYVREIVDGVVIAEISYFLNGKPRLAGKGESGFIASDPRYLIARMIAVPYLANGEVPLRIKDIQVEGAKVPREFIELMSPYTITGRYAADPLDPIGMAMSRLNEVRIEGGELVLRAVPGEKPKEEFTDSEVDSGLGNIAKFFGIAAVLFILLATTVIIIGLRAKRREESTQA